MADFADVDRVAQHLMQGGSIVGAPADGFAVPVGPALGAPVELLQASQQAEDAAAFQIDLKHAPDLFGLWLIHDQAPAFGGDVVAQHRNAADPLAALA